jgi:hypothetical protein
VVEPPQPAGSIGIPAHPEAELSPAPSSSGSATQTIIQLTFWEGIASTPARRPGKISLRLPPSPSATPTFDLAQIFTRVFRRLKIPRTEPRFRASFRRFTGLRSTIAFKEKDAIEAQISDLFEDASSLVVEAIAEILIARLFGRSPSREARDCYKAWANSPAVVRRVEEIHRQRGRKLLLPPDGRHFNLAQIFDGLNRRFFEGQVTPMRIGWSMNRSRRMLGHYDSSHHTITITRWLDAPRTPRYVVEYLVFHEMLHVRYPVERNHHRRIVHSKAFQAAERAFPHYQRAVRWLARPGWPKASSVWREI